MTDISELREGDEIEAVVRLTVTRGIDLNRWHGLLIVRGKRGAVLTGLRELVEIAEYVNVVRPEIIPGKAYIDAEGKLYVGKTNGRLVYVNDDGTGIYFHERGLPDYRPLPAGLRPANVVPAPATHDGPRRTVDAPAVHGGGRVVAGE